jgi:GT2 family glycosyltransferase
MVKILIAIPSAGDIMPETFVSLYNMTVPEGIETELKTFYGYSIDEVRNNMASYAVSHNFNGIMFVDSDMKLPKDTLVRMINLNKEVVACLYLRKSEDEEKIEAFFFDTNPDPDVKFPRKRILKEDIKGNSIIELAAFGFGCVLIKTKVFEKIEYPYFKFIVNGAERIGEDVFFCNKLREKQIKMYSVEDLRVSHIGKKEYKF